MAKVKILVGGVPTEVEETSPGLFGSLGYEYADDTDSTPIPTPEPTSTPSSTSTSSLTGKRIAPSQVKAALEANDLVDSKTGLVKSSFFPNFFGSEAQWQSLGQKLMEQGFLSSTGESTADVNSPSNLRNLAPGSRGESVTQLQEWLIQQGFDISAGATGFYGEQTKAAVAAWQESIGLDTQGNSGFFGPLSKNALKGIEKRQVTVDAGSPGGDVDTDAKDAGTIHDTGNSDLDNALNAYEEFFIKMFGSGRIINPDIELDPSVVQGFLDQATREIDPFFSSQIGSIKDEIATSLGILQEDFDLAKVEAEASFKKGLGESRESFAGRGLTFSGVRGKSELERSEAQDRALKAGELSTERAGQGLLTTGARTVGSRNISDLNLPNITGATSSLTGQGGFTPGRTLDFLKPSGVVGSLERDRDTAIELRQSGLEEAARRKLPVSFNTS